MPQPLYSHVLVPTNYEPDNQAAYRIAFAAAHSSKSVVSLLHVLPDQNLSDYRDLDAIQLLHRSVDEKYSSWKKSSAEAAEEKAQHVQRLRDEVHPELIGPIEVRLEVRRGDVADEIVKYASETGVDLIVTASSRPGILPDFSRSLSDKLARVSPVKILRVTRRKVCNGAIASIRSDIVNQCTPVFLMGNRMDACYLLCAKVVHEPSRTAS